MKTDFAIISWLLLFLAAAFLDNTDAERLDRSHALRGNAALGAPRLFDRSHALRGNAALGAPRLGYADINLKTKRD